MPEPNIPTTPNNSDYAAVTNLLGNVRQRIRTYVLAEAVLMALMVLGAVFWGGLLLDWTFEPSPQIRVVVHALLAIALVGIIVWWGLRRWVVALSDRSLALLIERKHPELSDTLSVAVDLHSTAPNKPEVHPELARRAVLAAAQTARTLNTKHLLNQLRLNRFGLLAGGLAISVITLAVSAPHVWNTYTKRLALSPDDWPRTVALSIDGFDPDGHGGFVRKVARNADVPIVINASLAEGLKAPDRVSIRYRWQEGRRGRDELVRIGDAIPGRDDNQRYEYLFERIAGNVEFDIRGGDDRLRNLRLEVVERPKVTELQFDCVYPSYLDRTNRQIAVGPRVELPEGTTFTARGKANKPLEKIRWRQVTQADDAPVRSESATVDFENTIALEANDVELEIELVDADGITSAEPFRVTVAVRRDQKPQVMVARTGIGTAITANAQLPVEVNIDDDNGVSSAWMDIKHDDKSLPQIPIRLPTGGRRDVVTLATVDLKALAAANPGDAQFAFASGQKITLVASADDHYDLNDDSRATTARALSFEIVTEDELMARLASAEQNLRQTFESVADKLLLLYDSLDKLGSQNENRTAGSGSDADLLVVDRPNTPKPENSEQTSREAGRLAETARQIGDEVLGVASGFQNIHDQLFNNRIENTELADRIGNRIASPLRKLGDERMQAVADRIADISKGTSSTSVAQEETRQAIIEVEKLLREMQGLENYNEVIAMLRDIIRQQEQVNTKTKEEQKNDLKNLLLD